MASRFPGPDGLGEDANSTNSRRSHRSESNTAMQVPLEIYVGEEFRIAVDAALDNFRNSNDNELAFPSSFSSAQRAYIHQLCANLGLKSKSKGKRKNRFLTASKKEINLNVPLSALHLIKNSCHQIQGLMQRFPLTIKEKQDLQMRTERQHVDSIRRDLTKATTGRLNNGVPQLPSARFPSEHIQFTQTLPVSKMKREILETINKHRVILISGDTGSGKTTQVPQMILDDSHLNGQACRIFCTQPRRLSALSVAERVAAERGEKIGQTVGYQIRLESRVSPKTLLTFCTNGVLLRTLIGGDNALASVTHVIVDEIHERDRFSDFLLIVLRECLAKHPNLRLILMSAALNTQLFSKYFENCPIVEVPGQLHDVQEYFLEDILKLTGYTTKKMEIFKSSLSKLEVQNKQLGGWNVKTEQTETPTLSVNDHVIVNTPNTVEVGSEAETLEEWVKQEMDQLLEDAWLNAVEEPYQQIFHLIMTENVSVDYSHSKTSATPLMIASGRGFLTVIEQLLTLGASIQTRASNDWTALDWADHFDQTEAVEVIKAHMNLQQSSLMEETNLERKSVTLTEDDKLLLKAYHHSFDDDNVDINLISALLSHIHNSKPDGAILVFLPGYDSIVALRDLILEDESFNKMYNLYVLHSSIQSSDQKRVFRPSPQGVRKIILSTNIAETSITIDDVVYVIDSGKVKEKSYDALTTVSMLKCNWISKASGLQRRGRAGRCQPGICFHLMSRVRYDSLQEYQTPEILRYPLHEICLHVKMLAPVDCSIAEFLSKAPEPPPSLVTKNAIQLLKQIDALDSFEDLTELGHHLADLPIEPQYSKMVLYSVVLKCLDPILTIACALSYKDPFVLPNQPSLRRAAACAKRKFSASTFSDHMALLRVFQAWQRARTEGWERSFCQKNFLSSATMEMIVGIRTQLLGQLRASGFVRARGGGDIRDLNSNSENWAVVKAALCAGMYPNIIQINHTAGTLHAHKAKRVRFHASSVLNSANFVDIGTHAQAVSKLPSDWVFYEEMTKNNRISHARCCTLISPITLAIFAGPAKISYNSLQSFQENDALVGDGSDSEAEDEPDWKGSIFKLDDWIQFRVEPQICSLVLQLRHKWHTLFMRRMRAPSKPWSQVDESVIRAVINILSNEEATLGLQQPSGIGQRPKPMSAESLMMEGGKDFETIDGSIHSRLRNTNQSFGQFASPLYGGKNEIKRFNHNDLSDRSLASRSASLHSSQNRSSSAIQTDVLSTGLQQPTVTRMSHLNFDAFKMDSQQLTNTSNHYFIIKASNHKILDISQINSLWATNVHNEKKLNEAFKSGQEVFLIFSVHGSGHFQGFAKMTSIIGAEKTKFFSSPGLTGTFSVEWRKRGNLPFQQTQHLVNPWNENKRVQVSRDGQELEPTVGETLVKLWEQVPIYQPRFHTSKTHDDTKLAPSTYLSSSTSHDHLQTSFSFDDNQPPNLLNDVSPRSGRHQGQGLPRSLGFSNGRIHPGKP